jgi:hypothetical protein
VHTGVRLFWCLGVGGSRHVLTVAGWAKFMEWKYPVEIVITNKAAFKGAGAIEAAATL